MKRSLLVVFACLCAMGSGQAQEALQPVSRMQAKPLNVVSLPQGTTLLNSDFTASKKQTRTDGASVEAKVLSMRPGADRNVYKLTGLSAGETSVATYYSPELLQRFHGNQVTAVRTSLLDVSGKTISVWVMDGETGEILAERSMMKNNLSNKEIEVAFNEPYTIDAEVPIFVGYTVELKSNTGITVVNNYTSYGLLIQMSGDDRMYDYSGSYPNAYIECVTEGEGGLKTLDVALTAVDGGRTVVGGEVNVPYTFCNYGTEPVKKLTYTYTLGGKEYTQTIDAGENTVPYLSSAQAVDTQEAPAASGRNKFSFNIVKVNDADDEWAADNSGAGLNINIATPARRVAVVEEFTGTWCGWCTRGMVAVEKLKETYPDDLVAICVHASTQGAADPMADASYMELLQYTPGFPSAMVNRVDFVDPYYGSNETINDDVDAILTTPAEAKIGVSSELSEDKTTLNATAMLQFGIDASSDAYSVAYVLVEDGITGYEQTNYYDQAYASQTGFTLDNLAEDLQPLYTAGSSMSPTFNDVSRKIEGCLGIKGSLSGATIANGKSFIHEYSIAVPSTIANFDNVSLVAMLIDNETMQVVTAAKAKLNEMAWTGIEQVSEKVNANICVSEGAIEVSGNGSVEVYTADGKLMSNVTLNGSVSIPTMGMKGVHLVRVVTTEGIKVAKVALK